MVSKRQFAQVARGAMKEYLSTEPEERAAAKAVWRQVCFDTLQDEIKREALEGVKRSNSAQAISAIRRQCARLVKAQEDAEREIRIAGDWSGYKVQLLDSQAQDKLLYARLPQFAWDKASTDVSANAAAAVAWIQVGGYELLRPAVDLMMSIAMSSKFRNPTARVQKSAANSQSALFWRPIIRTCGGAHYFLCFAVAAAIADQMMALSYVAQGRPTELDPFATPPFLGFMKEPTGLWTDRFEATATALALMPEAQRGPLVAALARLREPVQSTFAQAARLCATAQTKAAQLEKENVALRKRATRAEERVAELAAANQAGQERLSAALKAPPNMAKPDHEREIEHYVLALRERDARLSRLQSSFADTAEKLASTRDLLAVLLAPSPDAPAKLHNARVETPPEDWRIEIGRAHV